MCPRIGGRRVRASSPRTSLVAAQRSWGKSESEKIAESRQQLSEEKCRVTRRVRTERAFSSDMCSLLEAGIYSCPRCATILFDAFEKYETARAGRPFTLSEIVTPQPNI